MEEKTEKHELLEKWFPVKEKKTFLRYGGDSKNN